MEVEKHWLIKQVTNIILQIWAVSTEAVFHIKPYTIIGKQIII